jgi:hypothetical protein
MLDIVTPLPQSAPRQAHAGSPRLLNPGYRQRSRSFVGLQRVFDPLPNVARVPEITGKADLCTQRGAHFCDQFWRVVPSRHARWRKEVCRAYRTPKKQSLRKYTRMKYWFRNSAQRQFLPGATKRQRALLCTVMRMDRQSGLCWISAIPNNIQNLLEVRRIDDILACRSAHRHEGVGS